MKSSMLMQISVYKCFFVCFCLYTLKWCIYLEFIFRQLLFYLAFLLVTYSEYLAIGI